MDNGEGLESATMHPAKLKGCGANAERIDKIRADDWSVFVLHGIKACALGKVTIVDVTRQCQHSPRGRKV